MNKIRELFGIDLRALGVFRILFALLFLCDQVVRLSDLRVLYTDYGVLPRVACLETYWDPWIFSVHLASGSLVAQAFLFVVAILAGFALLVGYRTSLAAFLSWFMILCEDARNPMVLGEGVFIRLFLFWAMFLPLGERYSIDRVFRRTQERENTQFLSMATLSFLLQVALVYACAGFHKLRYDGWREGWAVFNSLAYDPLTKPLGYWLMQFHRVTWVLNYLVIGTEVGGALLLFSPFFTPVIRLVMVFALIALQLGFALCLELGPLPWSMITATVLFLPSAFWDVFFPKASFSPPAPAQIKSLGKIFGYLKAFLKEACVSFVLVYVLLSNWASFFPHPVPPWMQRVGGSVLWMDQFWTMFAPAPRSGGWNVIEGRQNNGRSIDLLNHGKPLSWQKPALISHTFKSQLWRKYWMRLLNTGFEIPRAAYASYLCRDWNEHHPNPEEKLKELEIFQMQTELLPHYQITVPRKISYGKYSC